MHPAESSELRKWYFLGSGSSLVALVALRVLVFPEDPDGQTWKATLGSLSDSLIAGLVTSTGLAVAYVIFAPRMRPRLREVLPRDIADVLQRGAESTQQYRVRARTANYFTKQTLPTLVAVSQRERTPIDARLLVLDPADDVLMQRYADFREADASGKRLWTPLRVRLELYASLARAVDALKSAPRSSIEVCLSRAFWAVSLDFTSDFVVITGQYKGDPAILVEKSDRRYRVWQDEFDTSYSMGRRIDLRSAVDSLGSFSGSSMQSSRVMNELLAVLDLPPLSEEEFQQMLSLDDRPHHYA